MANEFTYATNVGGSLNGLLCRLSSAGAGDGDYYNGTGTLVALSSGIISAGTIALGLGAMPNVQIASMPSALAGVTGVWRLYVFSGTPAIDGSNNWIGYCDFSNDTSGGGGGENIYITGETVRVR